jgi:hypothetical protein
MHALSQPMYSIFGILSGPSTLKGFNLTSALPIWSLDIGSASPIGHIVPPSTLAYLVAYSLTHPLLIQLRFPICEPWLIHQSTFRNLSRFPGPLFTYPPFPMPSLTLSLHPVLRFAKCSPTWAMIMWMQPLVTQLWSLDTRYSNTRSPLYVRRRSSTSTKIDK